MPQPSTAISLGKLCKFWAGVMVVAAADFWLWPQIFTEKITVYDNQTQTVTVKQADFEQVRLYLDDFFDQWHTSSCFGQNDCDFIMFLVTYATYTTACFVSCIVVTASHMPRFGIVLSGITGTFFNVFHSYIVRGRYLPPDSLVMWGAQFGSVCGPSFYSCAAYLLEAPRSDPIVLAQP